MNLSGKASEKKPLDENELLEVCCVSLRNKPSERECLLAPRCSPACPHPCLMQQQKSHVFLQSQEKLRPGNVNRGKQPLNLYSFVFWGFFRPAATAAWDGPHGAARCRQSMTGHGSGEGHTLPGLPLRRARGVGGRPWQERWAYTSARPQISL